MITTSTATWTEQTVAIANYGDSLLLDQQTITLGGQNYGRPDDQPFRQAFSDSNERENETNDKKTEP